MIPTASEMADTGPRYERLFGDIGVDQVKIHPLATRSDGADPAVLDELREATGVFMTGGNQLRLSTTIGGTKVGRLLRQ